MTETERARWNRARAYAEKQGCDGASACEYAGWVTANIRAGHIVLPAAHEPWFAAWYRYANAAGRQA